MGVKAFDNIDDTGEGVQNLGKPDDVILERSLMCDNVLAEIVALKVAR